MSNGCNKFYRAHFPLSVSVEHLFEVLIRGVLISRLLFLSTVKQTSGVWTQKNCNRVEFCLLLQSQNLIIGDILLCGSDIRFRIISCTSIHFLLTERMSYICGVLLWNLSTPIYQLRRKGERALVISWAARSTQSKCAISASAHWMNEAKAMTGILHWHADTRS